MHEVWRRKGDWRLTALTVGCLQMGAARVVTATSGATNIALAKSFGADLVIDYKVEDIFSALPDDSVDLVYDSTQMT